LLFKFLQINGLQLYPELADQCREYAFPVFIFSPLYLAYAHLQQIANKPTTNFFVKAPLRGAFTKKLGLV